MVGHTVLASLMESQIWHQLVGSVVGGLSKGTIAFDHVDASYFSSSLHATGAFQVTTTGLEFIGSESE